MSINNNLSCESCDSSLFVIVPGFGGPHYEEKVKFLENNIDIINKTKWKKIEIRVCVYDNNIMKYVSENTKNNKGITWIYEKGIVGQFIHKHANPDYIKNNFDYVLIILDDIELYSSVDFGKIVATDKIMKLDVYTPCMTLDSKYQFKYMLHMPENPQLYMKITLACEAFCYFMPTNSYIKYWNYIDPINNPWIWGLDMGLYNCLGLRAGVINKMQMKHHYKGECYTLYPDINPYDGFNYVLNKFNVTSDWLANQKAVFYWVFSEN